MSESNRAGMQLHFTFQNYFFFIFVIRNKNFSLTLFYNVIYNPYDNRQKKPRETSHFANWHQFHWTHSWVCFTSTNKRWANVMSNYILKRHTKKSPVLSLCSTSLDTRSLPVEQTVDAVKLSASLLLLAVAQHWGFREKFTQASPISTRTVLI